MRLLNDTHVLVWYTTRPEHLRAKALASISDVANESFFSPVSFYELSFLRTLGRLTLSPELVLEGILADGFKELPLRADHGLDAGALPRIHGDPFDRLLVAQARIDGLTIVTRDSAIMRYPVATLEA